MVYRAYEIAKKLEERKISVEVINVRFLKPLDSTAILDSIKKTRFAITMEDGTEKGGLATEVENLIIENNIKNVKFIKFAYPDEFIKHGSVPEIEKRYGMDTDNITNIIESVIEANNNSKIRGING